MNKRLAQLKSSAAGSLGGAPDRPMMLTEPLIVMFKQDDSVICHIHPADYDHRAYGLLLCDLVRHIANAFKVDEDDVWEWVDKERRHPTTEIKQPS
jgi:hypothetical protein